MPMSEPRPRRGAPAETRARIVAAAAEAFEAAGYTGTDTNRIARAAGYAPGTFYKHFEVKRAVFLAVYDEWVAREWADVGEALSAPGTPSDRAERVVDLVIAHHRRWATVRASLRALVAVDEVVRDAYRASRRRQLAAMARLTGAAARDREADALLLFTIERAADALADGEARALGLRPAEVRSRLVGMVRARAAPRAPGVTRAGPERAGRRG